MIALSVKTAAELVLKVKKRKNKFKTIPGWNRNVKNLHSIARNEFLNWVRSGKTQNSQEYCRMNESRKEFKLGLNNCKINDLTERLISIDENYRNKNMTLFWKEVKAASNRLKRSVIIDGKTEYGLALWNSAELSKKHIFKVFRTAFHNAFKKITGASTYHSSHDIAINCKQLLFEHYLPVVQTRYFKRVLKSKNSLLTLCRPYLKMGYHMSGFFRLLRSSYDVSFVENDLDIIKARISYVQRNENQTGIRFFADV